LKKSKGFHISQNKAGLILLSVIAKRLIFLVPTLFGLIALVFFISNIIPSDPAALAAGSFEDQKQIQKIRVKYGFDKPIHIQFWFYLKCLIRGDLGESLYSHRPILWELGNRFAATVELTLISLFLSVLLGMPFGVFSAIRRNTWVDHFLRAITIAGLAIAAFWLANELQLLFGYKLDLFPVSGRITGSPPEHITGFYLADLLLTLNVEALLISAKHLALPVMTMVLTGFATIVRFTRVGMIKGGEVYFKDINILNMDE
jgi:peptide/nickel transport system permease protein